MQATNSLSHKSDEDQNSGAFTVVIRIRPPLPREQPGDGKFYSIVQFSYKK